MSKVTIKTLQAEVEVLKKALLDATQNAATTVVKDDAEQKSEMKFVNLRKEFVIEITDDRTKEVVAQLKFNSLVKWDNTNPDVKGVVLGSWLKMEIEKPRGTGATTTEKMVPVMSYLSSKNRKGFMYLGNIPVQVAEQKEAVTC